MLLKLSKASNEKDVENYYRAELEMEMSKHKTINSNTISITAPFQIDGLLDAYDNEGKRLLVLLEFKKNMKLNLRSNQCAILVQMLYYLKKFQEGGRDIPSIVFSGDANNCFICTTNHLVIRYLTKDIDWNMPASQVAKTNIDLVKELENDIDIQPILFEINESFKLKRVIDRLIDLSKNAAIEIEKTNAKTLFDYFSSIMLVNNKLSQDKTLEIFSQILTGYEEVFLHPKKPDILVTEKYGQLPIRENVYNFLFNDIFSELSIGTVENLINGKKSNKQNTIDLPKEKFTHLTLANSFQESETEFELAKAFYDNLYANCTNTDKSMNNVLQFLALREKSKSYLIGMIDFEIDEYSTQNEIELFFTEKSIATAKDLFKNKFAYVLSLARNDYQNQQNNQKNTLIISKELCYYISKEKIFDLVGLTDYNIANTNTYKAHINKIYADLDINDLKTIATTQYHAKDLLELFVSKVNSKDLYVDIDFMMSFGEEGLMYLFDYFISIFKDSTHQFFVKANANIFLDIMVDIIIKGYKSQFISIQSGIYTLIRNDKQYEMMQGKLDDLVKCKKRINGKFDFDKEKVLTHLQENLQLIKSDLGLLD